MSQYDIEHTPSGYMPFMIVRERGKVVVESWTQEWCLLEAGFRTLDGQTWEFGKLPDPHRRTIFWDGDSWRLGECRFLFANNALWRAGFVTEDGYTWQFGVPR
jgi:hypothetical protein